MVDVLYDKQSGTAYVLASSVEGKLCLYHLNLEGTSYISDLTGGKDGKNGKGTHQFPYQGGVIVCFLCDVFTETHLTGTYTIDSIDSCRVEPRLRI